MIQILSLTAIISTLSETGKYRQHLVPLMIQTLYDISVVFKRLRKLPHSRICLIHPFNQTIKQENTTPYKFNTMQYQWISLRFMYIINNPYISTLKLTFFYISIQSSSSQGDQYSLENGHDNLTSLILLAKVEKKIFFKKLCILHDMATLYYTRTPAPGVMTFIILLEHFLFFIIMYSLCLLDVHRHKFYSCYPQIKAFLVESREIYIFSFSFLYRCNIPRMKIILAQDGVVNERRTTMRATDDCMTIADVKWCQQFSLVTQVTYIHVYVKS